MNFRLCSGRGHTLGGPPPPTGPGAKFSPSTSRPPAPSPYRWRKKQGRWMMTMVSIGGHDHYTNASSTLGVLEPIVHRIIFFQTNREDFLVPSSPPPPWCPRAMHTRVQKDQIRKHSHTAGLQPVVVRKETFQWQLALDDRTALPTNLSEAQNTSSAPSPRYMSRGGGQLKGLLLGTGFMPGESLSTQ